MPAPTITVPTTGTDPKLATLEALHTQVNAGLDTLHDDIQTRAPIASPTFTGTVAGVTKAMVGLGSVDNVSAASLRDRTTHTGAQAISTVTGLQTALDAEEDARLALAAATTLGLAGLSESAERGLYFPLAFVSGTANAAVFTSPTIMDNFDVQLGSLVTLTWQETNTASNPTVDIDGIVHTAKQFNGAAIAAGDLVANGRYVARISGTEETPLLIFYGVGSQSLGILPGPYANDAAASAAGLAVGQAYRVTGGSIAWRQV